MRSLIRLGSLTILAAVVCVGLTSQQAPAQWVQGTGPNGMQSTYILAFGANALGIVAAGGQSTPDSLWASTDNGQSWTLTSSNVPTIVTSVAALGNALIVGSMNIPGMYYTTDFGNSWNTDTINVPSDVITNRFLLLGNTLYAATGKGVYHQTQAGGPWIADTGGMTANGNAYDVESLTAIGSTMFAAVPFGGVFRSTNNGASWTRAIGNTGSIALIPVGYVMASGSTLYAITADTVVTSAFDVYTSTDNANTWTQATTQPQAWNSPHAFAINGQMLFVGSDSGISVSPNGGITWFQSNQGLPVSTNDVQGRAIYAVQPSGPNLVIGTFGAGAWARPLSQFSAGSVSRYGNTDGLSLSLSANPVSNTTTLTVTAKSGEPVSVSLTDALGRTIRMLQDSTQHSGESTFAIDATILASGTYFVHVATPTGSMTQKLVVSR